MKSISWRGRNAHLPNIHKLLSCLNKINIKTMLKTFGFKLKLTFTNQMLSAHLLYKRLFIICHSWQISSVFTPWLNSVLSNLYTSCLTSLTQKFVILYTHFINTFNMSMKKDWQETLQIIVNYNIMTKLRK